MRGNGMREIGLLGLGVMGKNLALNIGRKGYRLSVFNWTPQETLEFMEKQVTNEDILAFYDLESFVKSLERPRKILLMIRSGRPVDQMIENLLPYLDVGDLIIDGGNSYYQDTEERLLRLQGQGIHFLGLGVSGGASGALNGPSLMPGGAKEAYQMVAPILLHIAAQSEVGPCCGYVGRGAAGHFVKMIHNGIEYGIMEGIAEGYDLLRKVLHYSSQKIATVFRRWNQGELNSFLIEITAQLMEHQDPVTGLPTVEIILDQAEQKGTGRWTMETALELGIPTPTLNAAVEARVLSYYKEERTALAKLVKHKNMPTSIDPEQVLQDLEQTLLFTNVILFSQGLWLMGAASHKYHYGIQLDQVLQIWKGGCIIRARLLDPIREILQKNPENIYLLNDPACIHFLEAKLEAVKNTLMLGKKAHVSLPVLSSALDYFLAITQELSPANLIQAQRDFFGAHTYRRIDQDGIFHTQWQKE